MPVPKNTTTKPTAAAEPETIEPDIVEEPATAELVYSAEPHDFEVRRAALELAINAREPDPVGAARLYYGFLAGDAKPEATA